MTKHTQNVLEEAVHLPPIERAEIVEGILSSFNFPSRSANDAAWAQEAEDRIDAYDRGEIEAIPSTRVFAEEDEDRRSESIKRNRKSVGIKCAIKCTGKCKSAFGAPNT